MHTAHELMQRGLMFDSHHVYNVRMPYIFARTHAATREVVVSHDIRSEVNAHTFHLLRRGTSLCLMACAYVCAIRV